MKFNTWQNRPTADQLHEHIDRFYAALQSGKLHEAFMLCPVFTFREPDAPRNEEHDIRRAIEAMFDLVDGYGYFDELKEAGMTESADPTSWLKHITQVPKNDEQFNLRVPKQTPGDVLANFYFRGEVTDITAIFDLRELAGAWRLSFKMLKVM
jgi:hypothetical protein